MTRAELIARLEAAEMGSRGDDAEIWWLVKPEAAKRSYWNGALGLPHELETLPQSGLGYRAVLSAAPHYTTSLDAALTLVPEGWQWNVWFTPTDEGPVWGATVNWLPAAHAYAESAALALVIASLKAQG